MFDLWEGLGTAPGDVVTCVHGGRDPRGDLGNPACPPLRPVLSPELTTRVPLGHTTLLGVSPCCCMLLALPASVAAPPRPRWGCTTCPSSPAASPSRCAPGPTMSSSTRNSAGTGASTPTRSSTSG